MKDKTDPPQKHTKSLVLLNGSPPPEKLLKDLWESHEIKICADGAANYLLKLGIHPDIIIGDFDSVSGESLQAFSSSKLIRDSDQNTTDSEKAFNYCLSKGFTNVTVLGGFGDRIDHGLYSLSLIGRYLDLGLEICLYSKTEVIFAIKEKTTIDGKVGARISFLPLFGLASQVRSKGLKWEIGGQDLEFGAMCSISNVIASSPVQIEIKVGRLLANVETTI